MKKALFIFDQHIDIVGLSKRVWLDDISTIELFPLTSEIGLINKVGNIICSISKGNIEVTLLDSAELIDKEVDLLRERISKWSSDLGESKIDNRTIKDWFMLPGKEVSTWWFSLFSEKNTLKTDVYLYIAQLGAIEKIVSSHSFDLCFSSIYFRELLFAIKALCKRYSVKMISLSLLKRKKPILNYMLEALLYLWVCVQRAIMAKLVMGFVRGRPKKVDKSILFVSYFPYVDRDSAEQGKLRNRFAIPLQEKLSQMGKRIIWIWMFVFIERYSFQDTLKIASKFAKNREMNFYIEEFMTLGSLFRVIFSWFRQVRVYIILQKKILDSMLYGGISIPESAILLRSLMTYTFVGWTGMEGILYFELYKGMFRCFSTSSHCIYYCEMQAWEKALNSAKQFIASKIKSIGFQHIPAARNLFHYFYHPNEMVRRRDSISLPLPDILATNGDIPYDFLKGCGYPNIRKVESIRHLYLIEYLNGSKLYKKENIVLIAGSINRQETRSLLSLFYEVFPKPERFKVWLKGHPSLPFDEILADLNINIGDRDYVIKNTEIKELLKSVKILVVGSSSIALEALAVGCKVIVPIFSDTMFMTLLKGFEKYYLKVTSPIELKKGIDAFIGDSEEDFDNRRNFVSQYLCLDKSLKRWEEILKE